MAIPMKKVPLLPMTTALAVVFVSLFAACSGANGAPGSAHEASTWPASWCQAQPGATREQLVALMGRPTTSLDSQVTWSTPHYGFYAFLAADGTARQLDLHTASLSDAEKERVARFCEGGHHRGEMRVLSRSERAAVKKDRGGR